MGFRPSTRSTVSRADAAISEGLDQDHLARGHVAALLLEHDQAVARDHRAEDARSLRPGGAHGPRVALELEDAALELAPARLLAHGLRGSRGPRLREQPPPARELE